MICAALRVLFDHQANEALLNRWHKPAAKKNTCYAFHLCFVISQNVLSQIHVARLEALMLHLIISAFIVPSWNYQNLISVIKLSPAVKLNQVQSYKLRVFFWNSKFHRICLFLVGNLSNERFSTCAKSTLASQLETKSDEKNSACWASHSLQKMALI